MDASESVQSDRNWKNHAILFTRLRHFRCTFLVLVQFSMALISSRRGSSKASSVFTKFGTKVPDGCL